MGLVFVQGLVESHMGFDLVVVYCLVVLDHMDLVFDLVVLGHKGFVLVVEHCLVVLDHKGLVFGLVVLDHKDFDLVVVFVELD